VRVVSTRVQLYGCLFTSGSHGCELAMGLERSEVPDEEDAV
jgi:hypothetical protein